MEGRREKVYSCLNKIHSLDCLVASALRKYGKCDALAKSVGGSFCLVHEGSVHNIVTGHHHPTTASITIHSPIRSSSRLDQPNPSPLNTAHIIRPAKATKANPQFLYFIYFFYLYFYFLFLPQLFNPWAFFLIAFFFFRY